MAAQVIATAVPLAPPPDPDRVRGRLVAIKRDGYGFISIGPDEPQFFVLQSDIPPRHWRRGIVVEFTPMPASRGKRNPRAGNPVPIPAEVEP
jgi:hypothetical protein